MTAVPDPDKENNGENAAPAAEHSLHAIRRHFVINHKRDLSYAVTQILSLCVTCQHIAEGLNRPEIVGEIPHISSAAHALNDLVDKLFSAHAEELFRSLGVTGIRHDLRTPLNHIIGYAQMLIEENEEDPACAPLLAPLKTISDTGMRLLAIVSQFGSFSPASAQFPSLPEVQGAAITNAAIFPQSAPSPNAVTASPNANFEGARVLVVDDVPANRDMLSRRLQRLGCETVTANNGGEALTALSRFAFDVVLLDVMMPEISGFEVLQKIKADRETVHIPVVMVSALDEFDHVVRCIEAGAEDYLAKPINPVLLRARVGACLEKKRLHDAEADHRQEIERYNQELEHRVRHQVGQITQSQLATIFALSKLAESRDPETGAHLERLREFSRILAIEMRDRGCSEIDDTFVENIFAASPLHDIGKVGIPDHILLKPGKLTQDEFEVMKTHTSMGADTLMAVDATHPGNTLIVMGIEIAQCHHEKWNGSGYPLGLQGKDIPLAARILALADVYDALRSNRVYKEGFSHEKAKGIITESKGTHFDPEVVDCFEAVDYVFNDIWNSLSG